MKTMMKLLDDLRFVIGAMFGVFGLILLGLGLAAPPMSGLNLNLFSGCMTTAFAALMLVLALRSPR